MTLQFVGKTAIITGGGGALGKAYALELARRGCMVVVNDIGSSLAGSVGTDSSSSAENVVREIRNLGGKAISNFDSVLNGSSIVAAAVKEFGSCDILINNAGILRDRSMAKMTKDDWRAVLDVHLEGTFNLCHAAWPVMQQQKYGRIVNIGSGAGLYGNFGQSNYSSAKMGVWGLTNTLAVEGQKYNIQANCVVPVAGSRMTETVLPMELLQLLSPEHVSPIVAYLAHEDSAFTGQCFEVGGGWYSQVRLQRSAGVSLMDPATQQSASIDDVARSMHLITDFSSSTYPTSPADALRDMMMSRDKDVNKMSAPKSASAVGCVPSTPSPDFVTTTTVFQSDQIFGALQDIILNDRGRAADLAKKLKATVAFHVASGSTVKKWTLKMKLGEEPSLTSHSGDGAIVPNVTLSCSDGTLLSLADGSVSPEYAYMRGWLRVDGQMGVAMKVKQLLMSVKLPSRRSFAAAATTLNAKKVIENPFDRFANTRKKHEVLNRRVKGEDRNVGRAREKAIDERKTKLMKDYQTNKKSNTMVDRRFGEMDPTMSLEEKMFLRFQKERTRHVRKSSSYNLGDSDNELLTHRGQVLGSSNINDADWVSSDDEDPSLRDAGRLDRDVVNALHFGGGLRPKDGDASVRGTKLDALQEIVMKSKLHKMQKREAKEEQETERTKLDRAYEELMGTSLLTFDSRTGSDRRPEGGRSSGEDAYDQSLVEMMYEARLPASERTKSAEELALEEQRRIEDLETRRLERMKAGPVTTGGVNEGVQGRKRGAGRHVSDDAIDDDSFRCNDGPADRQTGRGVAGEDSAAYNEYIRVDDIQDEEYEDSEEDGEEGSDCDGEEDEGDDSGGEDSDDGDEDSEDEDDNGEDDSDDNPNETSNASIMKSKKRHDANKKAVCSDDDNDSYDGNPRAVVKRTKKEQAIDNDIAVNLEMPHKIECPADLEAFDELVEEYVRDELVDLCALVDRIIAWNSVHLPGAVGKENRQSMHNFLDVLLKHFVRVGDSLSINDEEQQKKTLLQLDHLSGSIFRVSTDIGEACASLWGRTVRILHSQLQKRLRDYGLGDRDKSCWPSLGRILLLQLLGQVFSVSDRRNDVSGPATALLCQCLTQCPVSQLSDICSGLLVCSVLVNYQLEAKRYVPEVVAFLNGLVSMYAVSSAGLRDSRHYQSTFNMNQLGFLRSRLSELTELDGDTDSYRISWSFFRRSSSNQQAESPHMSIAVLNTAYRQLMLVADIYKNLSALPEILGPVIETLRLLRLQDPPAVPRSLMAGHLSILEAMLEASQHMRRSRIPLQWRKKVVSSIEMKAPRFQLDYTFKKDKEPDQDRAKLKQLSRQLKREQKAAMRELRRDSDFIDQERYREAVLEKTARKEERHKNFAWMESEQANVNLQVRKGRGLMRGGGSGVGKKARVKRL